jgi:hypothetical protein
VSNIGEKYLEKYFSSPAPKGRKKQQHIQRTPEGGCGSPAFFLGERLFPARPFGRIEKE